MGERESQTGKFFEELTLRDEGEVLLPASKLAAIGQALRTPSEAYQSLQASLKSALIEDEKEQRVALKAQHDFLLQRGVKLRDLGERLWADYKLDDPLMMLCLVATNDWKLNRALYQTVLEATGKAGLDLQIYPSNRYDWGRSVLGIMAGQAGFGPEDLGIRNFPAAELKAAPVREPERAPAVVEKPVSEKVVGITPAEEKRICERLDVDPVILRLAGGETRDLLKPPTSRFWTEEEREQRVVMVGCSRGDQTHFLNPESGSIWALTSIASRRGDYQWIETKEGEFYPIIEEEVGETIVKIGERCFLITEVVEGDRWGRLELTPVRLGANAPPMPEVVAEEAPAEAPPPIVEEEVIPPPEEVVAPQGEVELKPFEVAGDRGNLITAMLKRKGSFGASRAEVGGLQAVLSLTHKGERVKLTISGGELLLIREGEKALPISGMEKDAILRLSLKDEGKTRIRVKGFKADVVYMGIEGENALFAPVPREEVAAEALAKEEVVLEAKAPVGEKMSPPQAETAPESPPAEAVPELPPVTRRHPPLE